VIATAPEVEVLSDVDVVREDASIGPTFTPPLELSLMPTEPETAPDWLLDVAASPATSPVVCCANAGENAREATAQAVAKRRKFMF
jgi:hypothetical protein